VAKRTYNNLSLKIQLLKVLYEEKIVYISENHSTLMKVGFYGAARTVTGSCFMIEDNIKIAVDVGMFQGSMEKNNHGNFPFDPASLDAVILTHAHLDHAGLLPKLVKKGFEGVVYATSPTRELVKYMLYDSAKIQEEEAKTQTRRNLRKGLKPVYPVYTHEDVKDCLNLEWKKVEYGKHMNLGDITITLYNSGHVLGSAFVNIQSDLSLTVSGDLGEPGSLAIMDPELPGKTDYLIIESTYGDRNHKSMKESIDELNTAIHETFKKGGNVLIPSFALERTQELLYALRLLQERGDLPDCQIFLDSPLAIDITSVYSAHPELYSKEALMFSDPFRVRGLTYTRDVEESKEINEIDGGAIIIAGSGMCTGGRIKHHLKHNLWREECGVIFVGFQAKGTLGRRIVDGAEKVRIYGEEVAVRAKIYTINGFSSHAGKDFLLEWSRACDPRRAFVVHGEMDISRNLALSLEKQGITAVVPEMRQVAELV
jgi:metallo-beta-lactamase family protein